MRYNVKNNGKKIGEITRTYKKNLTIFAVASVIGFSIFSVAGCQKEKDTHVEIGEDIVVNDYESVFKEPYYNVLYTVKPGDNLTSIVYSYESDANKVYKNIDKIVSLNRLSDASLLRDGITITLVNVPESKLEQFGYSADYNLFDPSLEINDLNSFVEKHINDIYITEENKVMAGILTNRASELEKMYEDYKIATDEETKTYLENYLIEEYRDITHELESLTGYKFDTEKNAYPLSEAINSYSYGL